MPTVLPEERMLFMPHMELPGVYRCVLRFGYMDLVDQGPTFTAGLLAQV